MTPTELSNLRRFIEALHAELAIMFGELKAEVSSAEGVALTSAGIQLETARLLEVQGELRRFLTERAGPESFRIRRYV